jgi:hypothetical protein
MIKKNSNESENLFLLFKSKIFTIEPKIFLVSGIVKNPQNRNTISSRCLIYKREEQVTEADPSMCSAARRRFCELSDRRECTNCSVKTLKRRRLISFADHQPSVKPPPPTLPPHHPENLFEIYCSHNLK